MVLTVVIGGVAYLRRYYRPTPRKVGLSERGVGSQQAAAAVPAHGRRDDELDVDAWEDELEAKLHELEERFADLVDKLGRVGEVDGDAADVVRVLSRKGMRREELLPSVKQLRVKGMEERAIAKHLRLSEEQMKLVQRMSSGGKKTKFAVGE